VSTPNPFPDIPVTVAQIIRQAGHKAYQRGLAYARQREVVRYTYDEDENTLEGLVNGNTPIPYEVDIRFFPGSDADSNLFNARCTCPVAADCKHAVALMRATVGERLGVKASGGIRTAADALAMVEAGANRLGLSASAAVLEGLAD